MSQMSDQAVAGQSQSIMIQQRVLLVRSEERVFPVDTSFAKRHVTQKRTENHSFLCAIYSFLLESLVARNRGTPLEVSLGLSC